MKILKILIEHFLVEKFLVENFWSKNFIGRDNKIFNEKIIYEVFRQVDYKLHDSTRRPPHTRGRGSLDSCSSELSGMVNMRMVAVRHTVGAVIETPCVVVQ